MRNKGQVIKLSALIMLFFVITTLFTTIQSVMATTNVITADPEHEMLEPAGVALPDHQLRQAPDISGFEDDYGEHKRIEKEFIRHQLTKNRSTEEFTVEDQLPITSKVANDNDVILNLDVEKSIYTPGETVNFSVQATQGLDPASGVTFHLYILKGETTKFWRFLYRDESPGSLGLEVFKELQGSTDSSGFYYNNFIPDEADQYIIVVKKTSSNYWDVDYRYITVSPVGIFWRLPFFFIPYQSFDSYAMVLNASDFTPIEGAEVKLTLRSYDYDYDLNDTVEVFTGQSGANGLSQIKITNPFLIGDLITASLEVIVDGQSTIVSRSLWSYRWSQDILQKYEFIITTDKPIYQPGETIRIRAIVRDNDFYSALKQPAPGVSVTIEVKTPSRFLLFRKQVVSNERGVVLLDFSLDEDTETGSYYLELTADESKASYEVEVKRYEKPAFRVIITPDKEYVEPGKLLTGEIFAEYYFGKPVIDGEVTINFFWQDENTPFGTATGTTGPDGKISFEQQVPILSSNDYYYYRYYSSFITIEVTVEDPVGREVSTSTTVSTFPDLYVWGYLTPWLPLPGDNLTVRFYSYQYAPERLSDKPVTIKVYGVTAFSTTVLLRSFTTTTNDYGSGSQAFSLSDAEIFSYLKFLVEIEIDTGDGREGYDNFYFQYAVLGLDLSLPKNVFERGESVPLTISVVSLSLLLPQSVEVRLYVNDPEYDSLYRTDLTISGSQTVSLKLGELAPHGQYRIYSYIRYRNEYNNYYYYYFSRNIFFQVSDTQEVGELKLNSSKTQYSSSETMKIDGEFTGTTNAPLIVEITKRGVISVQTFDDRTFNLEITGLEELAPRVFVFLYAFDEQGRIHETYLVLDITRNIEVTITADKEIYEPGETATITITLTDELGNPASGLAAISFIDSSIFGVKEDQESELEYFEQQGYWSWMTTATNMKGVQPYWYYYWGEEIYFFFDSLWGYGFYRTPGRDVDMVYDVIAFSSEETQKGGGPPSDTSIEVKVRSNLPESMYWMPDKWIDGEETLEIILPDNIGEWTVRTVLTYGSAGEGLLEKSTFKTQLPFFVEMTKPAIIKQDDVVVIKGVVYNYLDTDVIVNVSIEANGFEILNLPEQRILIPADYLADVGWSLLATGSGSHNVTIYAFTSSQEEIHTDAIQKTVWIDPNGIPYQEEYSGAINGSEQIEITVYNTSVSTQAFLVLSSGFGDLALDSWQRLAGYPYGCVEQTISRIVPDALILSYLNKTGSLTPEIRAQLEDMLFSGISRLYAFQHTDGGWGWWSDDSSNIFMTAIVLQGLVDIMKAGVPVEETVIKAGMKFLADKQHYDGHWTTNSWRIDDYAFTALTASTLQMLADIEDTTASVSLALTYLKNTWTIDESVRNPYSAAILLKGFQGTGKLTTGFLDELNDYLVDSVKVDDNGIYWSYDDTHYWRSLGGNVETTATALVALYEYDKHANLLIVQDAIEWIVSKQKSWGWGSTADTSAAIRAIMTLANDENENIDATIEIHVNGALIDTVEFNNTTDSTAGLINIRNFLVAGKNNVTLSLTGEGTITYYLRVNERIRFKPTVVVDSLVNVQPGSTFSVDLVMTAPITEHLVTDIRVKTMDWDHGVIGSGDQYSFVILGSETFTFNYRAPETQGIYLLEGIQVEYLLRFRDGSMVTDGLISMVHGPITINVTTLASSNPKIAGIQEKNHLKTASITSFLVLQDLPDIKFNKSISRTNGFSYGDTIDVTLDIHNLESDTYNFLVIEDQVPSGFILDESSLENTVQVPSYTLTSKGVSFFLPELDENQKVTVSYRLIATSVLQSMVSSAKLSQMYSDEWTLETEKYVIGDFPVKYSPATGLLVRDLDLPVIEKFSHEQLDDKVGVKVGATDTNGISRVKIYYGQENSWYTSELEVDTITGEWKGLIGPFSFTGEILAFVEVQDSNQNKNFSEMVRILVEIVMIAIPIIAVLMLIGIATGSGLTASQLIRKKLLKKVK
ncbi:MAG: MG2 domain-containing protein [Candidatus Hodarchaeales archaeon]